MSKKQDLIKAATTLFAAQGFDATTTAEIAAAAGVTEPVIYHYFKNKEGLFADILINIFNDYFSRLEKLERQNKTQLDKIKNLIRLHFRFVDEFPEESYLILSACPAKLQDSGHVCAARIEDQRIRLTRYISTCLREGIRTGEFNRVPVKATAGFLLATVNGLLRCRSLKLDQIKGLEKATVAFCRRSLCQKP